MRYAEEVSQSLSVLCADLESNAHLKVKLFFDLRSAE